MTILIKILQFIMSLSILVVIHELGHFTLAKIIQNQSRKVLSLSSIRGFPCSNIRKARPSTVSDGYRLVVM